jgi:hypothetical protein
MNLLQIVTKFCPRAGIPTPSTVTGSTDDRVLQVLALLVEEGEDLSSRHNWSGLTVEATHTTIAAENQGAITTIAPGYSFIKNQTLWDRTDQLPVIGPLNDIDWQAVKAVSNPGPRYQFRIRGGNLLITPTPAAGHTFAFEYQSENWVLDTGGNSKSEITSDTDSFLIPHRLMLMGLRWRWAAEKGLNYSELFNTYEAQVKDAMGKDGGKRVLHSDDSNRNMSPGIFVPNGNWTVP